MGQNPPKHHLGHKTASNVRTPSANMQAPVREVEVLILGAGLAGTSLAARLEKLGFSGRVTLLESRESCDEEARWCFWSGEKTTDLGCLEAELSALVTRSWTSWQVNDASGGCVAEASGIYYQEIWAPAFFRHFHSSWSEIGDVQLWRGTRVLSVQEEPQGVIVTSTRGTWRAAHVFDARHQVNLKVDGTEHAGHVRLVQNFVGWIVECSRPVFDPSCAVLMDFRLGNADRNGVHFVYLLPQSSTRALVESTHFGETPLSREIHESALARYLAHQCGETEFQVVAKEFGTLPMTTMPLEERASARIWRIGVAGGAARPSSGYAFGRIARQTERLARELVRKPAASSVGCSIRQGKYAALDAVFLDVMQHSPALMVRCFFTLFSRVKPASLVRFLCETSSWGDEARIIVALPKIPFCLAALRRIYARCFGRNENFCRSQIRPDALDWQREPHVG